MACPWRRWGALACAVLPFLGLCALATVGRRELSLQPQSVRRMLSQQSQSVSREMSQQKQWVRRVLIQRTHSLERCHVNMSAALSAEEFEGNKEKAVWKPKQGRYLFPFCYSGALSNQLGCIRNYFLLASLLNRTLILPRDSLTTGHDFSWRWDAVLGLKHIRECLRGCCSERAVVTVDEYLEEQQDAVGLKKEGAKGGEGEGKESEERGKGGADEGCVNITRVLAINHMGRPSKDSTIHHLKFGGVCIHARHVEDHHQRWNSTLHEFLKGVEDPVISLDQPSNEFNPTTAPFQLSPDCGDLWDPHEDVLAFVDGFLSTFIKAEYAALHLRRRDFVSAHTASDSGFLPIGQVAKFVVASLAPANVSKLYIASDGSPLELQVLEKLLKDLRWNASLEILRLPLFRLEVSEEYRVLPWVQGLGRLEEGRVGGVMTALAEKYICAKAKVFIGTPASTFTWDIDRVRMAHGWATCWDTRLQHSSPPPPPAPPT